jgi:hypothetical protein
MVFSVDFGAVSVSELDYGPLVKWLSGSGRELPSQGLWVQSHYENYFYCNVCVDVPFNSKIVNYLNLSVLVDVELEPPDHVRRRLSDFFDAAGRDRAQDEDRSGFLKKSIFSFC